MSKNKVYVEYKVDMRSSPDQGSVFSDIKGEKISKDLSKDIIETKEGYIFINPIKLNVNSTKQTPPSNGYFIHDHKNDEYRIIKSEQCYSVLRLITLLNTFTTDINKILNLDKVEIFRLECSNFEKNEVESLGDIPQDAISTQ